MIRQFGRVNVGVGAPETFPRFDVQLSVWPDDQAELRAAVTALGGAHAVASRGDSYLTFGEPFSKGGHVTVFAPRDGSGITNDALGDRDYGGVRG